MPLHFLFPSISFIIYYLEVSVYFFFFNLSVWDSEFLASCLSFTLVKPGHFRYEASTSACLFWHLCGMEEGVRNGPLPHCQLGAEGQILNSASTDTEVGKGLLITEWMFFFPTTSPLTSLQLERQKHLVTLPSETMVGVSAPVSVLPMNIQGLFPLG